MKQLLEGFEKIEVSNRSRAGAECVVSIKKANKTSFYFYISREAMRQAGLKAGDKVDLYGKGGGTFALVKSASGMYKMSGKKGESAGRINNTNLCIEVRSRTKQSMGFTAWGIGGEGVLFFKPKENDNGSEDW
jgi:hypothetical protein